VSRRHTVDAHKGRTPYTYECVVMLSVPSSPKLRADSGQTRSLKRQSRWSQNLARRRTIGNRAASRSALA
jgi:hypothetical protein